MRDEYCGFSFGSKILWHREHIEVEIKDEYAITAWAPCVMNDVHKDVHAQLTGGKHRTVWSRWLSASTFLYVQTRIYVMLMMEAQIVDVIWDELKTFRNCTPPFYEKSCGNACKQVGHIFGMKNILCHTQ